MTPEGRIQAYLKKCVIQTGGEFRKVAWAGQRGAPDCLIWWHGPSFAFVEVKTETGVLSKLQEHEIGKLRAAGFQVAIVRSMDDVDQVVFHLTQPIGCIQ